MRLTSKFASCGNADARPSHQAEDPRHVGLRLRIERDVAAALDRGRACVVGRERQRDRREPV